MRAHKYARSSTPFLLGLSAAAVIVGAGISLLPERAVLGLLVVAPVTLVVGVLAAWSVPAALAKSRHLAATLSWWHWLWFLAFASGLVFRNRTAETLQEAPIDFWAGWRIGLMGLVAMLLLRWLASRTCNWHAALVRGLPAGVFLFGLTSLASTLWSVYPMWTLYKSVEYLTDVALLAAVITAVRNAEKIKSLFDWMWLLYGVLLVTVWLGILLRPDVAVVKGVGLIGIQIQGLVPSFSSNGVGELAATLLVIAATRLLFRNQHRSFYWLVCLAALPTLLLAQSRSPFTGGLLALLAVLLLAHRFRLLALVGVLGAVLIALPNVVPVVQQAFLRGQSADMFYALSGRVNWWIPAWTLFRENPLLGLGGYAAGRFAVLEPLGATETASLHNAWLEILVGVGLVGFLPFLATFLRTWLNLLRPLDTGCSTPIVRELRIEAVGIFVLVCFRSIFTVELIWHPPLVFFLVLGFAELLRKMRVHGVPAAESVAPAWRPESRTPFRRAFAGVQQPLRSPVHGQ